MFHIKILFLVLLAGEPMPHQFVVAVANPFATKEICDTLRISKDFIKAVRGIERDIAKKTNAISVTSVSRCLAPPPEKDDGNSI
jgi:hypothetical protein